VTDQTQARSFAQLIRAHRRRIFGLIVSLIPNVADAEDVFQEITTSMWQRFGEFRVGTDFAAWGMRFARFGVLKYYERRRAAGRVTFSDDLLESLADEVAAVAPQIDARSEAVRACMAKLPEPSRRLIELRYEPEATCRSVAAALGQTVHTVYKSLNRVHAALLACVQRAMQEDNNSTT
jgi:RNA polymerase sigma-70 factor (ECF subfamily)